MTTSYIKNNKNWYLEGASSTDNEYILSNGLVNRTVILSPPKKKDLYVNCECDSEILRITKWEDEDEFYLTVYEYSPSLVSLTPSLLRRIGMAFNVLMSKKLVTKELIISKENFNKIKKFK
jgi:hypothetical protein